MKERSDDSDVGDVVGVVWTSTLRSRTCSNENESSIWIRERCIVTVDATPSPEIVSFSLFQNKCGNITYRIHANVFHARRFVSLRQVAGVY